MTYLTKEEFDKHLWLMRQTPTLTIDTEGTITHPHSETWGSSYSSNGITEYFGFNHMLGQNLPKEWLPQLQDVLQKHPCLVFHNAKHDLRALQSFGVDYKGKFYDTMLMAHMINENLMSKELDWLSRRFGGDPKNMPDVMKDIIKGFGWPYVPVGMMRDYAFNDAFITEELFRKLYPKFQEQELDGDLWQVEQDFVRLLAKIENTGVPINFDLAEREYARGIKIMKELERELGFNPNSPKQLKKFLIDELGLPIVKRTDKDNASFDKEAMQIYDSMLEQRGDKRAKQVLAYRGWSKTTSSNYLAYMEIASAAVDGRLRPNFKMHGTRTGRLSCEKPNLQQIPRESANDWNGHTKAAIDVDPGYRGWEFDYSQLEFRVGAAYGRVQKLLDVFNDPSRDIFDEMAADLGMQRQPVKTLNYTLQFGGGPRRISHVFGISMDSARGIIQNYYSQYPGLATIAEYTEKVCKQRGYIKYWTGRRRHIPFKDECRKAFNSLCQGGAFEIVKRVMIELDKAGLNNDECKMDLQVHDSVRFSIAEGKENVYKPEIINIMENVAKFKDFGVKFKVGCKEWAEDSKELIAA